MQSCEERDSILSSNYPGNLESLVQRSILLIREHLFEQADFVNQSQEVIIPVSKPYPRGEILSELQRIKELEPIDIIRSFPNLRPKIKLLKGFYYPTHGKIYLNKGAWCIETIIHETLHACSLMSLIGDIDNRYYYLYEGITEFYTGYILYKSFPYSYQNCWRSRTGRYCQLTYEPTTKLWGAFCHFVPLSKTLKIYFYNKSLDWKNLFSEFVSSIGDQNRTFDNPLLKAGRMPFHEIFVEQCRKSFGAEIFDAIYGSRDRCTDFTGMKI